MVEFKSDFGAHMLFTKPGTKENVVVSLKREAAPPNLRLIEVSTSKVDSPSSQNVKNQKFSYTKNLKSKDHCPVAASSAAAHYDASLAPSKNCCHSCMDRFENHHLSNKMQFPLKKNQLKLLLKPNNQYKKRKIQTGGGRGGYNYFEKLFARYYKLMTNNQITALFTQLQSKMSKTISSSGHHYSSSPTPQQPTAKIRKKGRRVLLPGLGATSFFTLITLIFLEMILLSTVSNCAKTFYMHWNTSNSIFRIDNTDHIIDVNKGNLAFEFDQVHIICPVYEPGTFENETEKYIIYNVSKVEYETCRITNADPRVIAICDKPQKLMFFTITFRPFTPQPGGLEFLPGNDYYFISTSSKDDLYRRIGGRCSTNNMKVVFKVCCAPEEKNKTTTAISSVENGGGGSSNIGGGLDVDVPIIESHPPLLNNNNNQQQHNNINTFSGGVIGGGGGGGGININSANGHHQNNGIQLKPLGGTSINTNIDQQFNRIPMQTNGINVIGHNIGVGGNNGILLTPGNNYGGGGGGGGGGVNMIPAIGSGGNIGPYHPSIGQYHPGGQTTTGIRINNVPPQQQYPSHKHNNNNNGKDQMVDQQQELGIGGTNGVGDVGNGNGNGGINIGNQIPKQFKLPPIIDTNHSNIVQSTMNWPPPQWSDDNNNNYNNNINFDHNTNKNNIQNPNISANESNHYHSPPHRTPSTTTTSTHYNMKTNKNEHYDKHPNEVVKNEELTYNSASATIHRPFWSWRKLFASNIFYREVVTLTKGGGGGSDAATISVKTLSKLENILRNLLTNPLVFLIILFVTLVQYVFLMSSISSLKIDSHVATSSSLMPSFNAKMKSKELRNATAADTVEYESNMR